MVSEEESRWFEQSFKPAHPDLVAGYLEARRIVTAAALSGEIDDVQLARLVELASSPRSPLGENAARMIGNLVPDCPRARDAVRMLSKARAWHARTNALVALQWCEVDAFLEAMIVDLLHDKSAKVRALAASVALGSQMDSLVAALDAAIGRESSPRLREELEWCRDLLRDGRRVEDQGDGLLRVTCYTAGGGVSRSFTSEEYASTGDAWVAEQIAWISDLRKGHSRRP